MTNLGVLGVFREKFDGSSWTSEYDSHMVLHLAQSDDLWVEQWWIAHMVKKLRGA
jgi:hypothetical protein